MRCVLLGIAAACGGAGSNARGAERDAVVYVTSNVSDADIYVDGQLIGPIRNLTQGIAVDPGLHRIELRHDRHFSRYAELTLRDAQVHRLELEMAEVLP